MPSGKPIRELIEAAVKQFEQLRPGTRPKGRPVDPLDMTSEHAPRTALEVERDRHLEFVAQRRKLSREVSNERMAEYHRERYRSDPEFRRKQKEKTKQWRDENPERWLERSRKNQNAMNARKRAERDLEIQRRTAEYLDRVGSLDDLDAPHPSAPGPDVPEFE